MCSSIPNTDKSSHQIRLGSWWQISAEDCNSDHIYEYVVSVRPCGGGVMRVLLELNQAVIRTPIDRRN